MSVTRPLTRCPNCGKLVPTTLLCIECGKPILWKPPKNAVERKVKRKK